MSVELVNGFVLLPHAPDWNVKPQFRREWRSAIADAVTGAEDRLSFRPLPLRGLEFQITSWEPEDHHRLVDRVRAARKSGWAAVPLWGRGSVLAVAASGASVTLASEGAWGWVRGDWVFFSNLEPETHEVRQIAGVAGALLTLDRALSRTYGRFCWPMLLGRFRCDDLRPLTGRHGSVRVNVLERDVRPEPDPDLCAILLLGDGGGDNFDCYSAGVLLNGLAAGSSFGGPWVDTSLSLGIQDEDTFEGYVDGALLQALDKGLLWGGAWVDGDLAVRIQAGDTFESYGGSAGLGGLAGGSGFAAAWVDSALSA